MITMKNVLHRQFNQWNQPQSTSMTNIAQVFVIIQLHNPQKLMFPDQRQFPTVQSSNPSASAPMEPTNDPTIDSTIEPTKGFDP